MNAPIRIAFATDTASAKSGMQDLAASVVGNMTRVSGAVGRVVEAYDASSARSGAMTSIVAKNAAAFQSMAREAGGYGNALKTVASTVAADSSFMGAAVKKAANDHNFSMVAMGVAALQAASQTKTGTAAMSAAWQVNVAPLKAKAAVLRNEIAQTWSILSASPAFAGAVGTVVAVAAGMAAIEGIEALTRAAAEQVARLAEIGAKANKFDVSTSFLQVLTKQARELGFEAEAVEKSLSRLKSAATVKQGDGGADARNESALQAELRKQQEAGNLSRADVGKYTGATNNEERMKVLLDLMRHLTDEGRQLAALTIGSHFLEPEILDRIRASSAELDKFRAAAHAVADQSIVSQDEIDRATELNRRLSAAHRILADGLKPIYDDLAAAGYSLHESNVRWVEFLARRVPEIINLYRGLKDAMQNAGRQTAGLPLVGGGREMGDLVGSEIANAARASRGEPVVPTAAASDPAMAAARAELAKRINPTTVARAQRESEAATAPFFKDRTAPKVSDRTGGGGGGESERIDAIERLVRAMEKANETAKAELDTLGKSNVEKEKAVSLAKLNAAAKEAGRAPTEQEIADVTRLAEATAHLKDKLKDQQQAAQQAAEAMRNFGQMGVDALADMILEGKSFDDVMKNLAKTLAKQALNGLLMGTGPLAGLLGTAAPASGGSNAIGGLLGMITSGFRANGGPVSAGRAYTVGEVGKEIFVPDQDGRMVPVSRNGGASGGGAGGGVTVNNYMGGQAEVETKRGQDGSLEVGVRAIEGRMAQRAQSGRGPMAPMYGSSAYRRG